MSSNPEYDQIIDKHFPTSKEAFIKEIISNNIDINDPYFSIEKYVVLKAAKTGFSVSTLSSKFTRYYLTKYLQLFIDCEIVAYAEVRIYQSEIVLYNKHHKEIIRVSRYLYGHCRILDVLFENGMVSKEQKAV